MFIFKITLKSMYTILNCIVNMFLKKMPNNKVLICDNGTA